MGESETLIKPVTTPYRILNRRGFEQRLEQAVISAKTSNHCTCYLDLDQFKIVNDIWQG